MDASSLESLGAITGYVNDDQQKRAQSNAHLASIADALSQSQNTQQGDAAFGSALLGSLGNGQPEAPAPGQPSVPGAQRAPAQAGGLSIPGFLNALKTSRFAGNGQAMAAALQKFLPLMQQQQQQTRLNQQADFNNQYRTQELSRQQSMDKNRQDYQNARLAQGQQAIDKRPDQNAPVAGDDKLVKAIAEYRVAPLSAAALRSPRGQQVMAAVQEMNPGYDATQFGMRNKAVSAFGTGKEGGMLRSMNTAIAHLGTLQELSDALGNGDTKAINSVANRFAEETGNPAPGNFDAAKQIVGAEIIKAIVAGGGGTTERQEAAAAASNAKSPAQLKGVINTYKSLLTGQVRGLKHQYEGTTGLTNFDQFLMPETRKELGLDSPSASAGGGTMNSVAPPEAVAALKSGQGTPEQFDAIFGPGAAARVMGK